MTNNRRKGADLRLNSIEVDVLHERDNKALAEMKRQEKRLKKRLVTYRLNSNTVICTTEERLPELISAHRRKR